MHNSPRCVGPLKARLSAMQERINQLEKAIADAKTRK
jgi:hypothetical protein